MTVKLTTFDPAEYLDIAHCLGIVARAKGMTSIAKETGLAREQLYKSFSEDGNPTLKNTIAVMKALGVSQNNHEGSPLF